MSRKELAGKEVATSSDNEGPTERSAKKARTASSASVMHVQPLRGDDDDGHNLLLSTLTGDHGVFMAEAEVNKIEDWYDSDIEHYDPENDWQVPLYQSPLFNAHADQWICFQTLTGGLGALFYDSSDQVVWATSSRLG